MSRVARAPRERTRHDRGSSRDDAATTVHAPAPAPAPESVPGWSTGYAGTPFALGTVQRKVAIGEAHDPYEVEAERVSKVIASGGSIAPESISQIASGGPPVGQRAAAPADKKKEEEKAKPPVQKAAAPAGPTDKKKEDEKAKPPVQKAAAPAGPTDKKKDDDKAKPPVQKAAAPAGPAEKREDENAKPPVQKAAAPAEPTDKKKEDEKTHPPVQKAAAPAGPTNKKKNDDNAKPPVQKAAAPAGPAEKREDKKAKPPVQKAAAPAGPTDKKKADEKAKPPVQKATAPAGPADKKKEEKGKRPAQQENPVQKAEVPSPEGVARPEKKQEPEKPPEAIQLAEKERKGDERVKPVEEKVKDAPLQKAAASAAKSHEGENKKAATPKTAQRSGPPEKDREKAAAERSGPLQRDGAAAPTHTMEDVAEGAIRSKGTGEPMHSPTRQAIERGMGLDFSDVRVHRGDGAHEAAQGLEARAFTQGRDIWLGGGESPHDVGLMAHEATHVAQQTGSVHRMLVQRAGGSGSVGPGAGSGRGAAGGARPAAGPAEPASIDSAAKAISIPTIQVPSYARKADSIPEPLDLPKAPTRPADQRQVFANDIGGDGGFTSAVKAKVEGQQGVESATTGKKIYFLQPRSKETYVIGDADSLPAKLTLPSWDKRGRHHSYDVDHIREMQLGGTNTPENMELLDSSANRSSGSLIRNEVTQKISQAIVPEIGPGKIWSKAPDPRAVQAEYQIRFEKKAPTLNVAGDPDEFWSRADLKAGKHLEPMKVLKASEIERKHLRGDATHLTIFPSERGGGAHVVPWEEGAKEKAYGKKGFLRNFDANAITYEPGKGGAISGTKFSGSKTIKAKPVTWALKETEGLPFTAYVDRSSVLATLKTLDVVGASPLELGEVFVDDDGSLKASGLLKADIPLLRGVEIDVALEEDRLTVTKSFSPDDLKLPGPIKVTSCTLSLEAGSEGLAAAGEVQFEIERLGQGAIRGEASTHEGLVIKGKFNFDSKLFDPAEVDVQYAGGKFSGGGRLGIPPGKVRGIESATITAHFDDDKIEATGSIKPKVPGIEQADLSMTYGREQGLVIGGHLELKKDIPGIAGGSVDATVTKTPGADDYKVKATGSATPKIPGISAQLTVSYDDGVFDIVGTAGYEKGRLKGSVTVGATNRPVNEDGQPAAAAAAPSDTITFYGGGSLTLRLAPWLEGTAAVKFKPPKGDIEVTGRIGLPAALQLFPEKALNKNIFTIGIDIPIVGVSVAGHRIGIFANISGGLDLSAGIGPGELQDLHLEVTYSPAHEEDTHVAGGAKLHIPAHAGLRLFVRGSLGAGIPIVSASAGLEVGGGLGLEGALDAAVNVDWTPARGLDITASAEIYVEPKLKFDITGFVLVEADLLIKTVELYSKRWQLAAVEYGSGLRFGLKLPVHYQEDKPFDISFSDIEIIKPELNAKDILTGLIKQIA
jgi:uncharacterized protein DUF4157